MTNFFSGYLALGTGTATSFVESTGSGYARKAITYGVLNLGRTMTTNAVTYEATGSWTAITQYAIYDASSGGNQLLWWFKNKPVTVANGGTFNVPAGSLTLAFPDLANVVGQAGVTWLSGLAVATEVNGNPVNTGCNITVNGGVASASLFAPLASPTFTGTMVIPTLTATAGTISTVTIGSGGPTITSGSGAPSGTQAVGSLYLNATGTSGTRLYVSAGSGSWTAVSGV